MGIFADEAGDPKVYAPYGLEDVLDMVLRPNALNPLDGRRLEKEARWCEVWPELEIEIDLILGQLPN